MTLAMIAALIIALGGTPAQAERYAPRVRAESERTGIPAEIGVAVMAHESRWKVHARGAHGEIGLGQIMRHTLASRGFDVLTDKQLEDPTLQIHLVFRHLARLRGICGPNPARYLSPYSGLRRCRPSPYSAAVLSLITPRS